VRVRQIADLFQNTHFIADRRRGKREGAFFTDIPGPHRQTGLDMGFDNTPQNCILSFG